MTLKKFFGIMIKKTIFTRPGFRGVPVAYGVVRAEKRALTAVAGPFWELTLYRFKARFAAKNLEPLDRTKIPAMTPMVGRAAL